MSIKLRRRGADLWHAESVLIFDRYKEQPVQLESHATPFGGTPQHRYATLHRAIEQGLDSDDLWAELAEVSATLGHRNEASRCVLRIRNETRRTAVERRLHRHDENHRSHRGSANGPVRAAASDEARGGVRCTDDRAQESGVVDHLVDSGQYLMHQHMPWLVITTVLAFPLVVGLGGFLTAGGSLLLLAAIAALPGLSVLAIVAAMGRQILLTSSEGICDVPPIPEFRPLLADARRFLVDATMVITIFFGPAIVMFACGAAWTATLPVFAFGMYFAPVAFALRSVRGDMRSLAPVILLRAAHRCGAGYPIVAAVTTLLFLPALVVAWSTFDRPLWVQIAIVGPLSVLPIFIATRLLGSWLDTRRKALGYLLHDRQRTLVGTGSKPIGEPLREPAQPRKPRRPEALDKFVPPEAGPKTKRRRATSAPAPTGPAKPRPTTGGATSPVGPTPRAIEGRRPAASKARASSPAAGARGAEAEDKPDLRGLPGAVLVSGDDRVRRGAASRRQ